MTHCVGTIICGLWVIAAADTYHIYQNMFTYIWIVKCSRNYNHVLEKVREKKHFPRSLLSLTNFSNCLCVFLAALFIKAVQLCIYINEDYPMLLYPIEPSPVRITINLINDRLCSSFTYLLINIPLTSSMHVWEWGALLNLGLMSLVMVKWLPL